MALQTLYNAPTLTISYDYTNDWLYVDWHGALDDDSVMVGGFKLLEMLKQQQCSKLLNDNTRITGLWADAAKWGGEVMMPLLYDAGCRHLAWVYSPERYSQLSAQLVAEHRTAGITILMFRKLDTAAEWLQQM